MLIKKKQQWIWEEEQQSAFEEIKRCLSQTDASNTVLGAVLTQSVDNAEYVISYASRTVKNLDPI